METDTILNYTYSFLQGSLYFNCVCLGLAVISIILCICFYIKAKKVKQPTYAVRTIRLIEPKIKNIGNINISYLENKIENLSVSKIALWNSGRDTIDYTDVAKNDNLKIIIDSQYRILDCSILFQKNKANSFTVEISNDGKAVAINFDYFDCNEGVILQVFHTGNSSNNISLIGRIKSVNRIKRKGEQKRNNSKPSFINKASIAIIKIAAKFVRTRLYRYTAIVFFIYLCLLFCYSFFVDAETITSLFYGNNSKFSMQFLLLLLAISYFYIAYITSNNNIPKGFDIFNEEFLSEDKEDNKDIKVCE